MYDDQLNPESYTLSLNDRAPNIDGQSDPSRYGAAPAQPPVDDSQSQPYPQQAAPPNPIGYEVNPNYQGMFSAPKTQERVSDRLLTPVADGGFMPDGGFQDDHELSMAIRKAASQRAVELGLKPGTKDFLRFQDMSVHNILSNKDLRPSLVNPAGKDDIVKFATGFLNLKTGKFTQTVTPDTIRKMEEAGIDTKTFQKWTNAGSKEEAKNELGQKKTDAYIASINSKIEDTKVDNTRADKALDQNKTLKEEEIAAKKEGDSTKQDKAWDLIVKNSNPIQASSRSALGVVTASDNRANRALVTLKHPIVTFEDGKNIASDLAGIYKGGSATESEEANSSYNTMYGQAQHLLQSLTGNPKDAMPEPIRQQLLTLIDDMKNTNKSVIRQQLDLQEAAYPDVIDRNRDKWTKWRAKLENGLNNGLEEGLKDKTVPPPNKSVSTGQGGGTTLSREDAIKLSRERLSKNPNDQNALNTLRRYGVN